MALVLAWSGTSALAQETAPEATPVGPPALRDFDLPGTVVSPAPKADSVVTPAPEADRVPTIAPPPPEPAEMTPVENRSVPAPAPRRAPTTASPQASDAAPPPRVERTSREPARPEREVLPAPETQLPRAEPPVAEAAPEPPAVVAAPTADGPPEGVPSWVFAVFALIAGMAAVAFLWKQIEIRRQQTRRAAQLAPKTAVPTGPAAAMGADLQQTSRPAAEPAAIPNPATAKQSGLDGPRPRVEIVFKPAKAEATQSGASVHYDLIVKNLGSQPAKSVAIEARMFNADSRQEKEIGAFFSNPAQERLAAKPFEIPPRSQAKLSRSVALDASQMRAVTIQGRRLFIPMVAFNILYEWEDADGRIENGQTSRCYVVGREPETPNAKMGAFRLDLGPRIYRSVGQRQTTLARNA
jgi:hypothetical protein